MKTTEQLQAENKTIRDLLAKGLETELRSIPGVLHVSVGLKETNGRLTDQLCIRVYVRQKMDKPDIPPDQLIPSEISDVPTDVNTVGEFSFQDDHSRYRPIKGGIEITNYIIGINSNGTGTQLSRGTLGCIAIDKTDNAPVLLSNWHVLFANTGRNGDKVFQPAPASIPPGDLSDLPLRPSNDGDKIAVLRRRTISDRVDGAIAAIDVSSCCHCCGIHYTNEINGLSVGGRPPRNTIVGDQRAVSGMTVFKVGKSTLRTEGRVVDDNHPPFSITKDGTTFTFTGQIAIQSVDHAMPFSNHGDSGSIVINSDNKIVGLLFAAGRNVPVNGVDQPFVSMANHISDVFSALNIRIEYSPDVVTVAGATLLDVPSVNQEAPIPQPYRVFRDRLESREATALLIRLGRHHSEEVVRLVNHCRPVMVTWHRVQGSAWLATLMGRIRDQCDDLPSSIKEVTLVQALERMRTILSEHGSASLRESLQRMEGDRIIDACRKCSNLNEVIDDIAATG